MPSDLHLEPEAAASPLAPVDEGGAPDDGDQPPEVRYRAERDRTAEVTPVPDPAADLAAELRLDDPAAAGAPQLPVPIPPFAVRRSGVYTLDRPVRPPIPVPVPLPPLPQAEAPPGDAAPAAAEDGAEAEAAPPIPLFGTEELRVDVDGVMPTMTVSGTITRLFGGRLTWIARVTRGPRPGTWTGPISYRDGVTSLRPHATVTVTLTGGPFPPLARRATATFSGGAPRVTLRYTLRSRAFRDVAFEYDTVADATAVTSHDPTSHPNHDPSVPTTTLTLESAYARVGVRVTKTGGDSPIPLAHAGIDTTWSDQEMHDAMEAHWSRWADAPQWALWVLFARLHDRGTSLGGIMFDDIGTAQRQGTAIFGASFIDVAPAGEANPVAWVERMKFWTAMHEIGHAFNLAHSWQKSLGTAWVPLADEPAALSYMNYPYSYPGGLDAFFAAFEYGFSPDELLFVRHAPERLVRMGSAPWFSEHGFEQEAFEQLRAAATGPLALELRVHRQPRFEFLEPVVAELKLQNVSSTAMVVDAHALDGDGLALVVARPDGQARRWLPFARYCQAPEPTVLGPGEALYAQVFLSAGTGGWLIDEPGTYTVYAAAEAGDGTAVLSRPLTVAVERPGRAAERLAGDVFTREVAHTLAFGGSRQLVGANQALRQVTEVLPDSKVAVHAAAVLGAPLASDGKVLRMADDGHEVVDERPSSPGEARRLLSAALGDVDRAADALGHIDVTRQAGRLADVLAAEGDDAARRTLLDEAADTLARRGVLPGVVEALRDR